MIALPTLAVPRLILFIQERIILNSLNRCIQQDASPNTGELDEYLQIEWPDFTTRFPLNIGKVPIYDI